MKCLGVQNIKMLLKEKREKECLKFELNTMSTTAAAATTTMTIEVTIIITTTKIIKSNNENNIN